MSEVGQIYALPLAVLQAHTHTLWLALVGLLVLLAPLVHTLLARIGVPALIGYLGLGFLLRLADMRWELLNDPVHNAFDFLADVGVVALLFEVGLKSHPAALAKALPPASVIWLGNMLIAALAGYVAAFYLLGLELIPALMVATALTATSVGVAVVPWREAKALDSRNGKMLVNVAELDDITGIALMAMLFALLPYLQNGNGPLWSVIGATGGFFMLKFALFVAFCFLFSRYLAQRLTHLAERIEASASQRTLLIVGIGFLIAGLANGLGFSLAIGALFAGLVFSRDPFTVKIVPTFQTLYAFFTPFFFIKIGLQIDPPSLVSALGIGGMLLFAAIIGKVIGAGLPALLVTSATGALILGVSMIPRAEIAMIIMHHGRNLGNQIVPDELYAGMVLVTAGSCIFAPWLLRYLLSRWPQTTE
jgi:Kef-type K+ transport system membrane component KefB